MPPAGGAGLWTSRVWRHGWGRTFPSPTHAGRERGGAGVPHARQRAPRRLREGGGGDGKALAAAGAQSPPPASHIDSGKISVNGGQRAALHATETVLHAHASPQKRGACTQTKTIPQSMPTSRSGTTPPLYTCVRHPRPYRGSRCPTRTRKQCRARKQTTQSPAGAPSSTRFPALEGPP